MSILDTVHSNLRMMSILDTLKSFGCISDKRYEWSSKIQGYVMTWYVIYYTSVDNYLQHGAWLTLPQIEKEFGHLIN